MILKILKGRYVVAVSGGVDSVVLLHLLAQLPFVGSLPPIIAHFDHGIRSDSAEDAEFVRKLARSYGFDFELGVASLGKDASEEVARDARYAFLHSIKKKYNADGILLAHHKNDVIETMAINIGRGTSPRGLIALQSTDNLLRPLLPYTKDQILNYANQNRLEWKEDATNADTRYTRNRLRSKLLRSENAAEFEQIYDHLNEIYEELDQLLSDQEKVVIKNRAINRTEFSKLPFSVGCELLARYFKKVGIDNIDKQLIINAAVAIRTYKLGKKFDLDKNHYLQSEKKQVVVHSRTI